MYSRIVCSVTIYASFYSPKIFFAVSLPLLVYWIILSSAKTRQMECVRKMLFEIILQLTFCYSLKVRICADIIHTHAYTHTHTHTHNTCMYTCTHAHTHTHTQHMHAHTHTCTCTHIHTYTHTQHMHVHTYTCTRTHTHNTCMYTHTCTCTPTHTHTHTHTRTTLPLSLTRAGNNTGLSCFHPSKTSYDLECVCPSIPLRRGLLCDIRSHPVLCIHCGSLSAWSINGVLLHTIHTVQRYFTSPIQMAIHKRFIYMDYLYYDSVQLYLCIHTHIYTYIIYI